MPVQTWTPGQVLTAAQLKTVTDMLPFPTVTAVNVNPGVAGSFYRCQPSAGGVITVTLPPPTAGAMVGAKLDATVASGSVVVQHNAAELIYLPSGAARGVNSITINIPDAFVLLVADGTNWHVLGLAPQRAQLTLTAGPPTTGTWLAGDEVTDKWGGTWLCLVAGTPGTWIWAGGGRYRASMNQSAAQSIPNSASTVINFGNAPDDPTGSCTTGASAKFTCPVPGKYAVSGAVGWAAYNAIFYVSVGIFQNGAEVRRGMTTNANLSQNANNPTHPATGQLLCAVGDTIDLRVFQSSGGAINTQGAALAGFLDVALVG